MKQQLVLSLLSINTATLIGLMIGGVISLSISLIFFSYFFLAPFNVFFSYGKQNRIKYIMTAAGEQWTEKVIFPSNKYYVDPVNFDIMEITASTPKEFYKKWNFLGMYWVGVPPFKTIYKYRLSWKEWQPTANGLELVFRDEMTPYLFAKRFAYGIEIKGAENSEGYPINLQIAVYVTATNAYKPIFGSDDAYNQLQSLVMSQATMFVKITTFQMLNSQKKPLGDDQHAVDEFSMFICELNSKIAGEDGGGIVEKFGYRINAAKIINVEIAGTQKDKIAEATIEVAIAGKHREAAILEGEGQAGAYAAMTNAEKERALLYSQSSELADVDKAREIGHSHITTYVEGDGKKVTPTLPLHQQNSNETQKD